MDRPGGRDGKQLLLSAALKLFATHGIDAVSIRAVNREAGLGPASVHYHFGTKDALVAAVLEIHGRTVSEQIRDRAREIAAGDLVTARDLVIMLVSPYLNLMDEHVDGLAWVQLVSRIIQTDRTRILDRSSLRLIRSAASNVYPNASARDLERAMTLCINLLVPQLVKMKQDKRSAHDGELLIDFLTGGLAATLGVGQGERNNSA